VTCHEDHVCLFCSFTPASGHSPLGPYTRTVFQSLVSCLMLPRLDYCNAALAGTLHGTCNRWWTRPHGRLRVIKVWSHHAALRQLHWLKVPWRINFKLAVLVYKCLHGLAPSYLADELHHPTESEFRRRLHSASYHYPIASNNSNGKK